MENIEWDPKNETYQDSKWDQKQTMHNVKLNCITKTEWDTTKTIWYPELETVSLKQNGT